MGDSPLATIDQATKRFGANPIPALKSLTTRIESGTVTGLVGPDGAGKTTLLRVLAGLMLLDEGELNVCGLNPAKEASALRRIVSYMPQRFGLYEDLTVIENLELYADLRSVFGSERSNSFERLFSFTGLSPFSNLLAGALSGGMKQKLGLACALIKQPRLLLLDEPSVGVDPISRRELWRMVYDLVDQGIGVVWSTAYLDEAERCASVLLLSEGQLIYDGPPHELTQRVEGRTYLIKNISGDRRAVLSRALAHGNVIDGLIHSHSVRIVVGQHGGPPSPSEVGAGVSSFVVPVPPRFEDALMDLLGGGPKGRSPFADDKGLKEHSAGVVVEARNLTRRFGSFTAADNINFEVDSGEIFGLIGPNGAGKSTTFKMLCGLLHPSEGTARVVGFDLAKSPSKARARLGYMAQKFSLYGDLSVRQNLDFFAGVYGLRGSRRAMAIDRMIDTFALGPYLDNDSISLPLGFKQRTALACAVIHDPDVLFLDEPTSGVDPRTRREFWSHINALVAKGVTIMVTTHFLEEAEYCDRIALIYRGRTIAHGAPDELKKRVRTEALTEPTLEDAFIQLVQQDDGLRAA